MHVSLREPLVVDGIIEVGVIVGIGAVSANGHSAEHKVDLIPAKMCAPFIDSDSEREVASHRLRQQDLQAESLESDGRRCGRCQD